MTLSVAVLVPVMVMLGFWQLQRAEYKRELETARYLRESALPVTEKRLGELVDLRFTKVALTGHFEKDRYFLLDNQVQAGKAGYRVIQVFTTASGHRYLIERGWVQAAASRDQLPRIPQPEAQLRIVALVWPDFGVVPEFLSEDAWSPDWPKRIQRLELNRMAQIAGVDLPLIMRLEAQQPGALVHMTRNQTFDSTRHTGYAFQWFTMSLVLLVVYVLFGIRRARERARENKALSR